MTEPYNFIQGKTAEYLKKKRNLTFKVFQNVEFLEIQGVKFDPSKIEIDKLIPPYLTSKILLRRGSIG